MGRWSRPDDSGRLYIAALSPTHCDTMLPLLHDKCRETFFRFEMDELLSPVQDGSGGCRRRPPSETNIFGQNASLAPFLHVCLPPLSSYVSASGYLRDGGEEEKARPRFIPPIAAFPGGPGLVCDLVSHMMETRIILLEVNIFQWNRGDSRRERRGEDERIDGRGENGI